MSVNIEWDNPQKTILRYDIAGHWTWDELREGRQTVFRIMDEAEAQIIYAIIHFTEGKLKMPKGGMEHFRELVNYSHPKAGLTVIVGANWLMQSIAGTFRSAYTSITGRSVAFEYAGSLAEARRIIQGDLQTSTQPDK